MLTLQVLLSLSLATAPALQTPVLQTERVSLFAGEYVRAAGPIGALVTSDFTGDGRADVAVEEGLDPDRAVAIYETLPTGRMAVVARYPRSSDLFELVAADVTGDGSIDLIHDGVDWGLLVGNGDGTFEPGLLPEVVHPRSLQAADFDGDGVLDIVAIEDAPGAVVLVKGLGGGAFAEAVALDLDLEGGAWGLWSGDIDGDGQPDLLVRTGPLPALLPYLNEGQAGFAATGVVATQGHLAPSSVVLGDVNADGRDDLLLGSFLAFEILTGQRDGTFAPFLFETEGKGAHDVVDMDGDGNVELILEHEIRRGLGAAEWELAGLWSVGAGPLGDLDGDGRLDVVGRIFTNPAVGGCCFVPVKGTDRATLGLARRTATRAADVIVSLDADGDGNLDVLLGSRNEPGGPFDPAIVCLRGNGHGGFEDPLSADVEAIIDGLTVCNVDADPQPEVVAVLRTPVFPPVFTLQVIDFDRDGAPLTQPAFATSVGGPFGCGDVDGDGLVDLVGRSAGGGDLVGWRRGLGNGAFAAGVALLADENVQGLELVDLDLDDDLDLVVGSAPFDLGYDSAITTLTNDGHGIFTVASTVAAGDLCGVSPNLGMEVVAGRIDDDELPDIVVVTTRGVCLMRNTGSGQLGPAEAIDSINESLPALAHGRTQLVDLDHDGWLDIITGPGGLELIADPTHVFFNDRTGSFGEPRLFSSGLIAEDSTFGDFDNDGDIDIATTGHDFAVVGVMLNRLGLFTTWSTPVGADVPRLVGTIVNEELRTLAAEPSSPGVMLLSFGAPADDQDLLALPDMAFAWGGNPLSWRADSLTAPVWVQAWFPTDGGDVQPSTIVRIRPD